MFKEYTQKMFYNLMTMLKYNIFINKNNFMQNFTDRFNQIVEGQLKVDHITLIRNFRKTLPTNRSTDKLKIQVVKNIYNRVNTGSYTDEWWEQQCHLLEKERPKIFNLKYI